MIALFLELFDHVRFRSCTLDWPAVAVVFSVTIFSWSRAMIFIEILTVGNVRDMRCTFSQLAGSMF